jgi:hypothetical protein
MASFITLVFLATSINTCARMTFIPLGRSFIGKDTTVTSSITVRCLACFLWAALYGCVLECMRVTTTGIPAPSAFFGTPVVNGFHPDRLRDRDPNGSCKKNGVLE